MADRRPPESDDRRRALRRSLALFLAIVAAIVVYAFAFDKTNVSLDQIQSETRQQQLFRILRALAHPDLIHYDTEDVAYETPIQIPCDGVVPEQPVTDEGPSISVDPACVDPGAEATVRGVGFEPGAQVSVQFVPKSKFDITLSLDRVTVEPDGTFSLTFEVPERVADEPQAVRAVTSVKIGSWRDRVEVWTDSNLNGVEDPQRFPETAERLAVIGLPLPDFNLRDPGGVALMDDDGNAVEFLSWGGEFEATTGTTRGMRSRDLGVDPFTEAGSSVQATGTFTRPEELTWSGPAPATFGALNPGEVLDDGARLDRPFINELALGEDRIVELAGPPGGSLRGWTLIFFDGGDGGQYKTVAVADRIDLSPRLSDNALQTWDRIVETVMLALVATTAGTFLAVPLSFFAARNLMRDVRVPLLNLGLALLGLPTGVVVGVEVARLARAVSRALANSPPLTVLGLLLLGAVAWRALVWGVADDEEAPPPVRRVLRWGSLLLAATAMVTFLYLLAAGAQQAGDALAPVLGPFGFLAEFVFTMGEILDVAVLVVAALFGAGALSQVGSRLAHVVHRRLPRSIVVPLTFAASTSAFAVVGVVVAGAVDWFWRFENPFLTVVVPAGVGGLYGLVLALRSLRRPSVGIGLVVYYIARTTFNALRSVEPLVMVIVFVVWVGIGPFAGSLALALHTTAALAKLYSEQVESISHGPIEAVRATGATRTQTIVYAVVPQIVPPYISFTMYRWDINVRMSTIIGFAGGGGIGFLLQQNINLLQYRAAAAQMLAIAIVVATMDYISSRLRERFV